MTSKGILGGPGVEGWTLQIRNVLRVFSLTCRTREPRVTVRSEYTFLSMRDETRRMREDRTFPTELAPQRIVNEGSLSTSKARLRTSISAFLEKKSGKRVMVSFGRSWERSRVSLISWCASSRSFLDRDSVREPTVSAGWVNISSS